MPNQETETTQAPTVHSLFAEVQIIGREVREIQATDQAILDGVGLLNDKLDEVIARLTRIEAREIRIEQEVSPPKAVSLVLSLGTTVPQ